jgi:hypothetical protein
VKTLIQWILSKLFPLKEEFVYGDNSDDCYIGSADIIVSIERSDNEIIRKLNS